MRRLTRHDILAWSTRRGRPFAGLLALVLLSACSAVPRYGTPSSGDAAVDERADRLVREADRLRAANQATEEGDRLLLNAEAQLAARNPPAAIRILEDVVRRFPDVPIHDRALYELATALVLTASESREYLPAVVPLDRLLREHPTSPYAADARALRMVIGDYVARTAERDRLLGSLRTIDPEFEVSSAARGGGRSTHAP